MVTEPSPGVAALGRGIDATAVLERYRVEDRVPLFVVGTFDQRVTVLSQQVRGLNLAWALVESRTLPTYLDDETKKVAVIGAGFAGLTFAAALIEKRAACQITIFEERDALLPLQQGSDTRWLHPNIYDWPDEGSEANVAMLPIMNWTAARASDVVVQVLADWRRVAASADHPVRVHCNARHLQIGRCHDAPERARVEWIGEERDPADGTAREPAKGSSASFDAVILSVGFGLEINNPASYWRNETHGQPSLDQPRRTYLLSGQGDGAMIDLLRLRISQYRQDRILQELFQGRPELVVRLKALRVEFRTDESGFPFFQRFEALAQEGGRAADELKAVLGDLARRLRRDTEVILQLKVRSVAELLGAWTSRTSFQNALLVYLLYRCGGFTPTTEDEASVVRRFAIAPGDVVRRHGTRRLEQLERLLSPPLFEAVETGLKRDPRTYLRQDAVSHWTGGYFGLPGRAADTGLVEDETRRHWRKEYMPGPTTLLCAALCGAVVGVLSRMRPNAVHFRTTLHRVLPINGEVLLQQTCDYVGRGLGEPRSTAGRTFPAANATIGLAYSSRKIVRTRKSTDPSNLQDAMERLKLNDASRRMSKEVAFILAMPINQPDHDHIRPSPVSGILYVDSRDADFWLTDDEVDEVRLVVEHALRGVSTQIDAPLDRIRSVPLMERASIPAALPMIEVVDPTLELLELPAPATDGPFVFNLDHSDITPLAGVPGSSRTAPYPELEHG